MSGTRADLVVVGQVVLRCDPHRIETAEAVGIADGRVVAAGSRREVLAVAAPGARVEGDPALAVVPGLHDFHLHLVGMARMRREVRLDGLRGPGLVSALQAAPLPDGEWLRGRGWSEEAMDPQTLATLNTAFATRAVLVYSHDTHSAWASPAALRAAGLGRDTPDPAGGRVERNAGGSPNGLLRERATDLAEAVAGRLRGKELDVALDEVLADLHGLGVTGATDAGDTAATNGAGSYAALGDRASLLLTAAGRLDGRLRLAIGFPADAIQAAGGLGLRTGKLIDGARTIRAGWAKAYADGALGSRTAALFEPYTCGSRDTGIVRLQAAELDELVVRARRHRIGLAVHAIGDRAAAEVLDALERGPARPVDVPPDRIEHLQLLRASDQPRLAALDVTASVQPAHCAADRALVEACWGDRLQLAYPWRSLAAAGTRLAFGSDAPIETHDPWRGMFAAVHRRLPGDGTADWQPDEALTLLAALAGYTSGAAEAAVMPDQGHLRPGAHADLAVLDVDLEALMAGDERLRAVRSHLTLVGGREVHRA
jgi:predicted amidohydrolase YtcJ